MSSESAYVADQNEYDWDEIERLIAEVSKLSRVEMPFAHFAKSALERLVPLLAARSAAFWHLGDGATLMLVGEVNGQETPREMTGGSQALVTSAFVSGQTQASVISDSSDGATHFAIAAPYRTEDDASGVIEVVYPKPLDANQRAGNEKLLAIVADLTGDFLRRQRLRELKQVSGRWNQFEILTRRVHSSLNLREMAFRLVNDGRVFVGCDRVSLLVSDHNAMRTVAMSGVDSIERRSHLVRALEEMGASVGASRQWLRYSGETTGLPPQVEKTVCAYADVSHAQTIDVVPLVCSSELITESSMSSSGALTRIDASHDSAKDELVGMLIFERFDAVRGQGAVRGEGADDRIARLSGLGGVAVRNSVEYDTLPFLRFVKAARRALAVGRPSWKRWVGVSIGCLAITAAIAMIPVPFRIHAQGELQPSVRREIYAPMDAEVVELFCHHDQEIHSDDVLLSLRSRDLELQQQRLSGEYQTTQKKLLAVTSARIESDLGQKEESRHQQLAAEEQELKVAISSLEKQLSLVRQQNDQLSLRSPIPGRVLTWNPEDLLRDRPVSRGQQLMSVADTSGPWELELKIPDTDIGWIKQRAKQETETMEVTFALAAGGDRHFTGEIKTIAGRTEVIDGSSPTVKVTATVPAEAVGGLRPGATVYAKIDCGKRSLGFIVFHDAADSIWRWLWF